MVLHSCSVDKEEYETLKRDGTKAGRYLHLFNSEGQEHLLEGPLHKTVN